MGQSSKAAWYRIENGPKVGHGEDSSTGGQRYGYIPRSAMNNLGEIRKKLGAQNLLF